jgi:hypothetical protein
VISSFIQTLLSVMGSHHVSTFDVQADCHRRSGISGKPLHPALKKTCFLIIYGNISYPAGKSRGKIFRPDKNIRIIRTKAKKAADRSSENRGPPAFTFSYPTSTPVVTL